MDKHENTLTAHERAQLTHDISEALQQMYEHPEQATQVLRILNNRIRPLGFRLEYVREPKE